MEERYDRVTSDKHFVKNVHGFRHASLFCLHASQTLTCSINYTQVMVQSFCTIRKSLKSTLTPVAAEQL